ncbi:hypothetical protein D918_02119 [Trichuris suis]|nr:hypothetical protein D918_02119 [Trichuris suis]
MLFILALSIVSTVHTKEAKIFWLGGLFDRSDVAGRIAFHLAVNEHSGSTTSFKSHVLSMNDDDDIVDLIEKTCSLLLTKMVAFLTAVKGSASENVRSLCESRDVPFLMTSFDYSSKPFLNSINLYPPPRAIGSVVASFAQKANWRSGVIFFQDDSGNCLFDIFTLPCTECSFFLIFMRNEIHEMWLLKLLINRQTHHHN